MAFINLREREIQIKLVYWGPPGAGKTVTLRRISAHLTEKRGGGLVTIGPQDQATSFMDFMAFTIPGAGGFDLKVRLYSVPGHARYAEARRILLKGTDGIVFVADLGAQNSVNRSVLLELESLLAFHGKKLSRIPLVFQVNKSDLPESGRTGGGFWRVVRELDSQGTHPCFAASACEGRGVFTTIKSAIFLVMRQVEERYLAITRAAKTAGISPQAAPAATGGLPERIGAGRIDARKLFRKPGR
jgi:hypothetical protein